MFIEEHDFRATWQLVVISRQTRMILHIQSENSFLFSIWFWHAGKNPSSFLVMDVFRRRYFQFYQSDKTGKASELGVNFWDGTAALRALTKNRSPICARFIAHNCHQINWIILAGRDNRIRTIIPFMERTLSMYKWNMSWIPFVSYFKTLLPPLSSMAPVQKDFSWSNIGVGAIMNMFEVSFICSTAHRCWLMWKILEVTTLGQPLEVVKTQMACNRQQTMGQALRIVWSRGGALGFYQGLIPWVSCISYILLDSSLMRSMRVDSIGLDWGNYKRCRSAFYSLRDRTNSQKVRYQCCFCRSVWRYGWWNRSSVRHNGWVWLGGPSKR